MCYSKTKGKKGNYKIKDNKKRININNNYKQNKKMKQNKNHIIVLGKLQSGKSSIERILFSTHLPNNKQNETDNQIQFLGSHSLHFWDGTTAKEFTDHYTKLQKLPPSNQQKKITALIYVFDATSITFEEDIKQYREIIERLYSISPDTKIFALIHKIDVFDDEMKDYEYLQKEGKIILVSKPFKTMCYATSIYDESLYTAWSNITYSLIPKISEVEKKLNIFCEFIQADEIVVYEASSLLVITYSSRNEIEESRRFENISISIKSFCHTCCQFKKAPFSSIKVELADKKMYFDSFTSNTYIMIVFSDPCLTFTNVETNVKAIKGKFEELLDVGNE